MYPNLERGIVIKSHTSIRRTKGGVDQFNICLIYNFCICHISFKPVSPNHATDSLATNTAHHATLDIIFNCTILLSLIF